MAVDLVIALVTETFHGPDGPDRLHARLRNARDRGAGLAVLPELPLHRWMAGSEVPSDEDAEPPAGPAHQLLATAARTAGIAVLGGAIVRREDGARRNTGLLFASDGSLVGATEKTHVPDEDGWREKAHYGQGERPAEVLHSLPWPVATQVCSDLMRPAGGLALAAAGARLILVPRATPPDTAWRWELMARALAVAGAVWVVSVNRPPEAGTGIGGPSFVVDPLGEVALASEAPLEVVTLGHATRERALREYPGSLDIRGELYAGSWASVARRAGATRS